MRTEYVVVNDRNEFFWSWCAAPRYDGDDDSFATVPGYARRGARPRSGRTSRGRIQVGRLRLRAEVTQMSAHQINIETAARKRCSDCRCIKSAAHFYKSRTTRDGLQSYCKICLRKRQQSWESAGGRARQTAAQRRYSRRHPERIAATYAKWTSANKRKHLVAARIRKTIYDGRLQRQPYEVCGRRRHVHGHHDDYAKPYEVRWLCAQHHRDWHRKNGEGKNAA